MLSMMTLLCLYTGFFAISSAYVNVALNKPSYQQYQLLPGYDKYDASNAVDGRKSDFSWDGHQCSASTDEQTATWWVNLTSIYSIHHITIYFITNNKGSSYWELFSAGRVLGFSVYVSNTTDRSQGTLCFKDNNFTEYTIPSVFTTNCFVHGQYVIYYNERIPGVVYPVDYLSSVRSDLCEVEVYGCPETGFYGSNCSIPCPDINCQYCHIETGTCQDYKPESQCHRCEVVGRLNGRNIEFYTLIGALGFSTIIITILIICLSMERRKRRNHSTDGASLQHSANIPVAYQGGAAFCNYLDPVERNTAHLYDDIQEDKL